jgi:hypothetical protein
MIVYPIDLKLNIIITNIKLKSKGICFDFTNNFSYLIKIAFSYFKWLIN